MQMNLTEGSGDSARQVLVARASGVMTPLNAGDLVAVAVDVWGSPIPRSVRARLGRHAKGLLDDGFDPNIVCAAMVEAIRFARPHLVESFALEIQTAKEGRMESFREYRRRLERVSYETNPENDTIRQALRGAFSR